MSDTSQTSLGRDYPIYVGVWTNWSLGGRISGSTLTLSHHNGALLTAFLALFVTFVGSKLWRIICFIIHRILQSNTPQDGLYHQCQAVLRNSIDEKLGLISFIHLLWVWRQKAQQSVYRLLPIVILSLLISACFSIGSIFSAKISSSMGNEVLISGSQCGVGGPIYGSQYNNLTRDEAFTIYDPWLSKEAYLAANYVQNCYSNNSQNCGPYIKKQLPSTIDRNASCPFHPRICRHNTKNIKIDTGYINSQTDLGINSPVELQFNVRRITHCAPLKSLDYSKTVRYSPDKLYVQYFYGTLIENSIDDSAPVLYTHIAEQQSAEEVNWHRLGRDNAIFEITTVESCPYKGSTYNASSSFSPVEELATTGGDVVLIFLSANGVRYPEKVDDDWYAAHKIDTRGINYNSKSVLSFLADEPASTLGCSNLYQVCDPSKPSEQGCTRLSGSLDLAFIDTPPRTKREKAQDWANGGIDFATILGLLQFASLTSRFRMTGDTPGGLPENQWQMDVENWHNILLASQQASAVTNAAGPNDLGVYKHLWTAPSNDVQRYICKNQKIISANYTNFSMLWIVIVVVVGSMIMLLQYMLEPIFVWLESHALVKISSQEWFSNDTLQLQRMAHEELGLGDWDSCTGPQAIPVTRKGQLLGVLDCEDPKHPRLVKPFAEINLSGITAETSDADDQEDSHDLNGREDADDQEDSDGQEVPDIQENLSVQEDGIEQREADVDEDIFPVPQGESNDANSPSCVENPSVQDT